VALFGGRQKDPYETEGEQITPPSKPAVKIPTRQPVSSSPSTPPARPATSGGFTTIGRGITIKGDLVGDEDVKIEGKVEGRVQLTQNLVVGQSGEVEADVQAENINIGGTVTGNIMAKNKVEIVASGTMLGDIKAPRVIVAEGAHFKGNVDMG
jgi:cytoskeletal protein CcmA (bactofilin family)